MYNSSYVDIFALDSLCIWADYIPGMISVQFGLSNTEKLDTQSQ